MNKKHISLIVSLCVMWMCILFISSPHYGMFMVFIALVSVLASKISLKSSFPLLLLMLLLIFRFLLCIPFWILNNESFACICRFFSSPIVLTCAFLRSLYSLSAIHYMHSDLKIFGWLTVSCLYAECCPFKFHMVYGLACVHRSYGNVFVFD